MIGATAFPDVYEQRFAVRRFHCLQCDLHYSLASHLLKVFLPLYRHTRSLKTKVDIFALCPWKQFYQETFYQPKHPLTSTSGSFSWQLWLKTNKITTGCSMFFSSSGISAVMSTEPSSSGLTTYSFITP